MSVTPDLDGTHVHIFESLPLESSRGEDLVVHHSETSMLCLTKNRGLDSKFGGSPRSMAVRPLRKKKKNDRLIHV